MHTFGVTKHQYGLYLAGTLFSSNDSLCPNRCGVRGGVARAGGAVGGLSTPAAEIKQGGGCPSASSKFVYEISQRSSDQWIP
jgi:hypothetical protein